MSPSGRGRDREELLEIAQRTIAASITRAHGNAPEYMSGDALQALASFRLAEEAKRIADALEEPIDWRDPRLHGPQWEPPAGMARAKQAPEAQEEQAEARRRYWSYPPPVSFGFRYDGSMSEARMCQVLGIHPETLDPTHPSNERKPPDVFDATIKPSPEGEAIGMTETRLDGPNRVTVEAAGVAFEIRGGTVPASERGTFRTDHAGLASIIGRRLGIPDFRPGVVITEDELIEDAKAVDGSQFNPPAGAAFRTRDLVGKGQQLAPEFYVGQAEYVAAESEAGEKIGAALELANSYGSIEGDHHRAWVIDQMVRALTGDDYAAWVAAHKAGEDGPETYDWEEGIAP